jgi:hypothetical protein
MKGENKRKSEMQGAAVLITARPYAGTEGICLGKTPSGQKSAVSPKNSDEILELIFEKDFSLLVDLSGDPAAN